MTAPRATGRIEMPDGRHVLVLTRGFRAGIDDVWAAVTEPARLARWIGRWDGDPTSGTVQFHMLFEEGDASQTVEIRRCEPPVALHIAFHQGDDAWVIDVDLDEADGVTTLRLTQYDVTPEQAESVGPGWEYYLDRMVDAETGGDPAGRRFDPDYYPGMAAHYRDQVPQQR